MPLAFIIIDLVLAAANWYYFSYYIPRIGQTQIFIGSVALVSVAFHVRTPKTRKQNFNFSTGIST